MQLSGIKITNFLLVAILEKGWVMEWSDLWGRGLYLKMAETGITSSVVGVTSSSSNNSVEKDSWEDKVSGCN